MKHSQNERQRQITIPVVLGILVLSMIVLFLSGRIVEIDKGTMNGGITSILGVASILIAFFLFMLFFIKRKY